jgi:hypothetical protein
MNHIPAARWQRLGFVETADGKEMVAQNCRVGFSIVDDRQLSINITLPNGSLVACAVDRNRMQRLGFLDETADGRERWSSNTAVSASVSAMMIRGLLVSRCSAAASSPVRSIE